MMAWSIYAWSGKTPQFPNLSFSKENMLAETSIQRSTGRDLAD